MACRSRRTLDSLRGLFDGFAGSASPVTVAFVSASMVGPNQQVMRTGERIATCALLPENWSQVGAAASAAGARLYIVEPIGMSNQVVGLDHLAGVTGGVRMHLGGAEENAFTRICARRRRSTASRSSPSPRSATATRTASSSVSPGPMSRCGYVRRSRSIAPMARARPRQRTFCARRRSYATCRCVPPPSRLVRADRPR